MPLRRPHGFVLLLASLNARRRDRGGTCSRGRPPKAKEDGHLGAARRGGRGSSRRQERCRPAQVHPRLAEAAAASIDDLQAALLDAALGATREHWITTTCTECSHKQRSGRSVEGRSDRASSARGSRASATGGGGSVAAHAPHRRGGREARLGGHADDLCESVRERDRSRDRGGGQALLRERVSALDQGQLLVLREALDEVAASNEGLTNG